jgi:hypothetical protein
MTTTQISQAERIAQLNEQIHSVHVLYNNAMNMRKRDGSVSRLGAEWDALLAEKRRVERLVPDQSVEVETRVSYEDDDPGNPGAFCEHDSGSHCPKCDPYLRKHS